MPRERDTAYVIHLSRPELGVGEVGEFVRGKPPVLQVYWPEPDKYGYYLSTDLRRVSEPPTTDRDSTD